MKSRFNFVINTFSCRSCEKRGYISPFAVFIILFFLVVAFFWIWERYERYRFPEKAARGEIKGITYYVTGIKNKINEKLERKDNRNKRALEIVEDSKKVKDKANLVTFEVPASWVEQEINPLKDEISVWQGQSAYFKMQELNDVQNKKVVYLAGARLTVSVKKGQNKSHFQGSGGHSKIMQTRNDIRVCGEQTVVHYFEEPERAEGRFIDAHVHHNGNDYTFLMVYNPESFMDAEYFFENLLESVEFLK